MILGIDCGTATFGWALVDHAGTVCDLGAIVQGVDADVAKSTDSSRRVANQADILTKLDAEHTGYGLSAIVHEAASYNARRFKMAVGLALSIGAVVGFARSRVIPLFELPPKRWQQAVTGKPGKVNYEDVYRRVEVHVARWQPAMDQLSAIKPRHRNHALDAAGIALCHAIDPSLATRVR